MRKSNQFTAISFFLLAMMLVPSIGKAEDTWRGMATFDPVSIPVGRQTASFGAQIGAYRNVHDYVMAGFGVGITEVWNFKSRPALPLFVGLHAEDFSESFTPTFDFQFGYSFNTKSFDYSTLYINPMVGVRFNRIGLSVGYLGGIAPQLEHSKWSSSINIRLAYYFGYHATRMSRSLSHLSFMAEASLDMPLGAKKNNVSLGVGGGLNIGLMWNATDEFEMGPIAGFHPMHTTEEFDDFKDSYSDMWALFALRGRYRFRDVSVGDKLYPWAQLDLGYAGGGDYMMSSFYWSPAVGVSYDVRDGKSSIDLGLGFNTFKVKSGAYGDDDFSAGCLRISLGYSF